MGTFYELLDSQMGVVRDHMHPIAVMDMLFTMYAFFCVMRENPEEGDIMELVKKMAYILVYESREKLGVDLEVTTMDQAAAMVAAAVATSLAPDEDEATKSRVLH